jgi:hypothetical protein
MKILTRSDRRRKGRAVIERMRCRVACPVRQLSDRGDEFMDELLGNDARVSRVRDCTHLLIGSFRARLQTPV